MYVRGESERCIPDSLANLMVFVVVRVAYVRLRVCDFTCVFL